MLLLERIDLLDWIWRYISPHTLMFNVNFCYYVFGNSGWQIRPGLKLWIKLVVLLLTLKIYILYIGEIIG